MIRRYFLTKREEGAPDPRLAATSSTVMRRMKKATFRKVQNNAECASTTTMDFDTLILASYSHYFNTIRRHVSEKQWDKNFWISSYCRDSYTVYSYG